MESVLLPAAERTQSVATAERAYCPTPGWCLSDPLARFARVSPSRVPPAGGASVITVRNWYGTRPSRARV